MLLEIVGDPAKQRHRHVRVRVDETRRDDMSAQIDDFVRFRGQRVRRADRDAAFVLDKKPPAPNLFAGEHNFHSRLEWVSVQDMEKAVEVIVNLARIWEERA